MINAKDYTIPLTADDLAAAEKFMQMLEGDLPGFISAMTNRISVFVEGDRNAASTPSQRRPFEPATSHLQEAVSEHTRMLFVLLVAWCISFARLYPDEMKGVPVLRDGGVYGQPVNLLFATLPLLVVFLVSFIAGSNSQRRHDAVAALHKVHATGKYTDLTTNMGAIGDLVDMIAPLGQYLLEQVANALGTFPVVFSAYVLDMVKNDHTPLTDADSEKIIKLMKQARNAIKKRR